MIKRLGILLIICTLQIGIDCKAQTQFSPTIGKIEKSIFGVEYPTQSDEARLNRIEEEVYGAKSTSSNAQRVEKLSKDLTADLIGQEIKPKKDTFAEDEDTIKEMGPKADKNINYPIVDSLENEVFRQSNKTAEINQRLANLEQRIFKKTYDDDLNSRVERLKAAVLPEKVAQEANYNDEDEEPIPKYFENEDVLSKNSPSGADNLWDNFKNNFSNRNSSPTGAATSIPTYNQNDSVLDDYQNNSDVVVHLAAVEKSILKKSFPDDTVTNRLARLELKVFNTTFIDDDEETRLDRVASAHQAKKTSSKYDNNKFSQRVSTAMQVGAFLLVILAAIL